MNVRHRKRVLWMAAGVFALAGVAVLAWGVAVPVRIAAEPGGGDASLRRALRNPATATSPAEPTEDPAIKAFEDLSQLCDVNLRRPLYDPPAAASVGPAQPAVSFPVRLVGMAYEPNQPSQSCAILEKADGARFGCAEGESVQDPGGPVTVVRIERQKVTVQHGGQTHVLVLPPADGATNE